MLKHLHTGKGNPTGKTPYTEQQVIEFTGIEPLLDLSKILQLSDQIVLMKNGRIADHGTLHEIIGHSEMRELIHEKDLNRHINAGMPSP